LRDRAGTLILAIILITGFAVTGRLLYRLERAGACGRDADLMRKVAATLESTGLWEQAARAYSRLLADARLTPDERARLAFHLGEIYLDKLSDPKAALPCLFTAKIIAGDSELGTKTDKRIVEALERSGRSLDAANYLSEATSLHKSGDKGKEEKPKGSIVIAKVGDREITMRDLENDIQSLPPEAQEQFKSPEGKMDYLQGMIARELLLEAARRAGFDDDPEVREAARKAREAAIIARYGREKIDSGIRVTESDVRAYYEGHKDKFKTGDKEGREKVPPYEQVKDMARSMLEAEKRQEKLNRVINELRRSEEVEIYRERLTEN